MRRDLGNEVIVAIVTVGVLAFALAFGIILSLSTAPAGATATVPSNTSPNTDVATAVSLLATNSLTPLPPEPTATDTATREATEARPTGKTIEPTNTATPTVTQVEPTATRTLTSTPTHTYTPTVEPTTPPAATTISPSDTARPGIATVLRTTETPSSTHVSTTETAKPTTMDTPVPTATPTPTSTDTYTPTSTLTATNTATVTPLPSPTRTPRPTETSGIIPTPTGTLTPAALPVISGCPAPEGWTVYTVHPGNTLFSIARAVGSTVRELRDANCLSDPDVIFVGVGLYVPRLPLEPVQTSVPNNTLQPGERPAFTVEGCIDPRVQITAPTIGAAVTGTINIMGTATLDNFWYYRIEVRPNTDMVYRFISRSDSQVTNGILGQVDTSIFEHGVHWIRVTVVDLTGGVNISPCAIPVIFR